MNSREKLRTIAEVQQSAEKTVDKFFRRGPFIWAILTAFFIATVAGATWTSNIHSRVLKLEEFVKVQVDDKTGEQVRQNKRDLERNQKQIRSLNNKVFGLPDPGE